MPSRTSFGALMVAYTGEAPANGADYEAAADALDRKLARRLINDTLRGLAQRTGAVSSDGILRLQVGHRSIAGETGTTLELELKNGEAEVSARLLGPDGAHFERRFEHEDFATWVRDGLPLEPVLTDWAAHGVDPADLTALREAIDPYWYEGPAEPADIKSSYAWDAYDHLSSLAAYADYTSLELDEAKQRVKRGDLVLVCEEGVRGPRSYLVLRREGDDVIAFAEHSRKIVRFNLRLAEQHQAPRVHVRPAPASVEPLAATVPGVEDFDTIAKELRRGGFASVSGQGHDATPESRRAFFDSLKPGDELRFHDPENGWQSLMYRYHELTVRGFVAPSRANAHDLEHLFTAEQFFAKATAGSVFIRPSLHEPALPKVDPHVYPTLSASFLEGARRADEAWEGIGREASRLQRSMGGMSQGAMLATQQRIASLMVAGQTAALEGLNARRGRELRSIGAVRGIHSRNPYEPLLAVKGWHHADPEKRIPQLAGRPLELDLMESQGVKTTRAAEAFVDDAGAPHLRIQLASDAEGPAVFAQLLDVAYAASLKGHDYWFPNNITDHRYRGRTTDDGRMRSGDGGSYLAAVETIDGKPWLRIDFAYASSELLYGLGWGHALRFAGPEEPSSA